MRIFLGNISMVAPVGKELNKLPLEGDDTVTSLVIKGAGGLQAAWTVGNFGGQEVRHVLYREEGLISSYNGVK